MNKTRIIYILDKLIEMCFLFIVFFVPISFSIFYQTYNVFELHKTVLFRTFVLLISLLITCRHFFNSYCFSGNNRQTTKKKIRDFLSVLIKDISAPLLFIVSLLLPFVFSFDKNVSFWGSYNLQEGLLSYLYLFLFFILFITHIKSEKEIDRIIKASIISSLFVSLYGFIQLFGLDIFVWNEPASLTHRISSSLGQPNFLATYLILVIPLSYYLIINSKKNYCRIFYFLIAILQITCLFFTYSFGGWIGFFSGLLIFLLIHLNYRKIISS